MRWDGFKYSLEKIPIEVELDWGRDTPGPQAPMKCVWGDPMIRAQPHNLLGR